MDVLSYLYLISIVLALITASITIALVFRSLGINGNYHLGVTLIFLFIYLTLLLSSSLSLDPVIRYFSLLLRLAALCLASAFNVLHAAHFTGNHIGIRQSTVLLASVMATVVFIMTDPVHHLVVSELPPVSELCAVFEAVRFGPGYLLYGIVSLLGCIIPAVLFLRYAARHRGRQARQARILGLANIAIIVPYVVYGITLLLPIPTLPPPLPVILLIVGTAVTVIFYRQRLIDSVPQALSNIFQQIDTPLIICNRNGVIIHLNPYAEKLFETHSITVGRSTLETLFNIPPIWRSLRPGSKHALEIEIDDHSNDHPDDHPDNRVGNWSSAQPEEKGKRVFTFTISVIPDSCSRPVGYSVVGYDMTDIKLNAQRRLMLEAERARSEFLAMFIPVISHEMRTPLTTINMAAHIAERTPDSGVRKEKLREIIASSMHIARVMSEVQELMSLDNPQTDSLQLIDMAQMVRSLPEDIMYKIQQVGLRYQVKVESAETVVTGNRRLLVRALHSLIDNAIRYSPPGDTIEVTLHQADGFLQVSIEDNGPGIAEEVLSNVFEPFYKVNSARTKDGSGMGLGLSLADRIARRHGGWLRVVSAPNQGSVFTIALPIHKLPPVSSARRQAVRA